MLDIKKISDSDFLSFLYSERDRVLSNKQYPGWSNWALAGIITTIICCMYGIFKTSIEDINVTIIAQLLSLCLAFTLSVLPTIQFVFFRIGRKRLVDVNRVSTFLEESSWLYIVCVLMGTLPMIIVEVITKSYSILFWLWTSYFILMLIPLIYILVQRKKLVVAWHIRSFVINFNNDTLDLLFIIGTNILLGVIMYFSVSPIQLSNFLSVNLELVICYIALWVVIYITAEVNIKSTDITKHIDLLIDKYIYSNATKEDIYKEIEILTLGKNSTQALEYELKEVQESISEWQKRIEEHRIQKGSIIENKITELKEIKTYIDEITITLQIGYALLDKIDCLCEKVNNILNLKIRVDLNQIDEATIGAQKEVKEGHAEIAQLQQIMGEYLDRYGCLFWGGLCGVEQCADRHKRPSKIERLRRRFKIVKTLSIANSSPCPVLRDRRNTIK